GEPGDAAHEVADQAAPLRRVRDLGMELHGIEVAAVVGNGGKWRPLRHRHHLETRRQLSDAIAVAHPHGMALARLPHPPKKAPTPPNTGTCRHPPPAGADLTRDDARPPPPPRPAPPWSARHSRCRARAAPPRTPSRGRAACRIR